MLNPDFLFDQTATIQNYEGYGMSGDKLGEPFTVPCRIQAERKRVSMRSQSGGAVEDVVSNALAFFPAGTRFSVGSPVVSDDGTRYKALKVSPMRAFGQEIHVEAVLL